LSAFLGVASAVSIPVRPVQHAQTPWSTAAHRQTSAVHTENTTTKQTVRQAGVLDPGDKAAGKAVAAAAGQAQGRWRAVLSGSGVLPVGNVRSRGARRGMTMEQQ
jgi:hypothetical protein